jgi:hypothetical protein
LPKKYTFEEVKSYIESNSGCKLLDSEYIDNRTLMRVTCEECEQVYLVRFDHFRRLKKTRCNTCAGKARYTIDDVRLFVEQNSGSKLMSDTYVHNEADLLFRCACGMEFTTTFKRFKGLNKRECRECVNRKLSVKFSKTTEIFAAEVSEVTDGRIQVIGPYKNISHRVHVRDLVCGHDWEAKPSDILHKKSGCPTCASSKGERKIREFLTAHGFDFTEQYKIDDCKNVRPLPFDFAIFINGETVLIEYDGIQHFDRSCFGGKNYDNLVENDRIKTKYCKSNKLKLIRIKYTDLDRIETLLAQLFSMAIPSQASEEILMKV